MTRRIEVKGKLIHECTIPGETRANDVFPGHPNGTPLSNDRWLVIYATRGWRKVDDDRSIVYQLRKDAPDGLLIKEGLLRPAADDWDPRGDGSRLLREHGHPVVFGVPKGARISGKPAPSANAFIAKWRVNSKGTLDPATGIISRPPEGHESLLRVEWVQFRLNDAEDDIEIVQPVQTLRQQGYGEGDAFCSAEGVREMNQTFVQAVPFNREATEWVDVCHFGGRIAALKYRFDPSSGKYDWTATSPVAGSDERPLSEASIARSGDSWLISARSNDAVGWIRTEDPFAAMPAAEFRRPAVDCPVTMYRCADGAIRLLTGERATSPYGHGRNPLYLWDVDPVTLGPVNPQVVFDCVPSGTLPRESMPRAEMAKLLPHTGGQRQTILWRVRTKNVSHPYGSLPPVTEEWKERHGIYYAEVEYDGEYAPTWEF